MTLWVDKDHIRPFADSEDSDQPVRICKLISVFVGRACRLVGNAMPWLNST